MFYLHFQFQVRHFLGLNATKDLISGGLSQPKMPHFESYLFKTSHLGINRHTLKKCASNQQKQAQCPEFLFILDHLTFEPNLTTIFKYLMPKTVRRNSLLSLFLRPKNEPTIEFRRTVLDCRCFNIVFKLGSNDQL